MKNSIPLILAVLLGLAAVFAVNKIISTNSSKVEEKVRIVAATRDLAAGEVIAEGFFMPKEVPLYAVPAQAIQWSRSSMIIGQKLKQPVRKGNYIMFSSGYLEYATPDTKVKVVGSMLERGIMNVNEARDVFQLPHLPGGTARMIRGEYYMIDDDNKIIAESGGRTDHDTTTVDEPDLLDEPEDNDDGGTA